MSSTSAVEVSIHAVSPLFGAGASAAQASAGASRAKSAARRLEARANLAAVGIALSLNPVDRMTKRPLRRRSPARKLWLDARMTCAERVQIPCHCGFRSSFRGLRELARRQVHRFGAAAVLLASIRGARRRGIRRRARGRRGAAFRFPTELTRPASTQHGSGAVMSVARVACRALVGLQAPLVHVEVSLASGLPAFCIVGLPATVVKESKERVRAALLNSRFEFPAGRITVNLAPADLPKEGGRFDLPIALGILIASGQIRPRGARGGGGCETREFYGELGLTGELK